MAKEIRVIGEYVIDMAQLMFNAQICNKETNEQWEVVFMEGHEEDAIKALKGVMKDQGLKPDDLQQLALPNGFENRAYYIDIRPSHSNG